MAAARSINAGETHFVTRNCVGGQFLLRPSPIVNAVVLFCLALGALRFGVQLHAVAVMSSHLHLILTDPRGRLPDFMELVDSLIARALNYHHERSGAFWEPGSYSDVLLETAGETVKELAYTLLNPVAAGCVPSPDQWTGLITPAGEIGSGRTFKVTKPEGFFRREGAEAEDGFDQDADDHRPRGREACEIPDSIECEWTLPPFFGSADELQRGLKLACATRLREIEAEWRASGRSPGKKGEKGFRGARACEADSIYRTASGRGKNKKKKKLFSLDPRRMGRAKDWTRSAAATSTPGREEFWRAHREAMAQWRAGDHEVVFPTGTWKMHRLYGARCLGADGRVLEGSRCARRALERAEQGRRLRRGSDGGPDAGGGSGGPPDDAGHPPEGGGGRSSGGGGSPRRDPTAEA